MAIRPPNTGRVSTIVKFYLNKKVSVVVRAKSFSKRLHNRSIWYNEVTYGSGKDVEFSRRKLEGDPVDYVKVAPEILKELIEKSSFLSNSDCILIFDIISKMKPPLIRMESGQPEGTKENNSGESINKNLKESYGKVSNVIRRAQLVFLKLIIDLENKQVLTNKERYYFICSLSRECSIINVDQWTKLFKNVREVLITKGSDSLFRYEPHEIANIILVYAQISRWAKKRQSRGNGNHAKLGVEGSIDLKVVDSDVSDNAFKLNGHNIDPFDLDLISIGIAKLLPNLDKMTSYKIIKLLYLLSSKGMYNNIFFQKTYIHFASSGILKRLTISDLMTVFKIYSKACVFKLLGSVEMFHYTFALPYPGLLSNEKVRMLNLTIPTVIDRKGVYLATQKNISSKRNTQELDLTLEMAESLCLIVLNIATEHLLRMTSGSNISAIKKFSIAGITEMYDKDWKWIEIVEISEKHYSDMESARFNEGANYTSNQLGSLIQCMSHLVFLTKVFSQSLTLCADKYRSTLKRILFLNGNLNTLLAIILENSKGHNEDQQFIEDSVVGILNDT